MTRNSDAWAVIAAIIATIVLILVGLWGFPRYNVYEQTMAGRARLAEAESSRMIATVEAEAKRESAEKLADAEIARAKGVAQANKIIGDSLRGNEAYLRYLWIQSLQEGKSEVIYVPTEANLPILEASRKMIKKTEPEPTK